MLRAPLETIDDEAQRGLDREAPRVLRHVLLQNVVLNRAAQLVRRNALFLRRRDVERPENDRRAVDRHRRRHLVERDAVEQHLHVGETRDGDARLADFTQRSRMIRVVAHQRREVECRRQSRLAMLEQKLEASVRVGRAAEAGELPHRPQLAPVTRGVNAARERIRAGHAQRVRRVGIDVERGIDRLDLGRRVREADVSQLALGVAPAPFRDFGAQPRELGGVRIAGAMGVGKIPR